VTALESSVLPPDDRRRLGRRAQLLAAASVSYNLLEAAVAVTAGAAAGSVALIGFGLDSLAEVGSGLVILWQFRHPVPESRERRALRLIGASFFALAAYVTIESLRSLLSASEPAASTAGIGLAGLSLLIMPVLSRAQRRTGRTLGSDSVVADSTQTLLCTYLSAVLLTGLLLNTLLGWGWADPAVGLVIAAVAAREGIVAWRGDNCGCTPVTSPAGDDCCAAGPDHAQRRS
jgi:divalent metal cation (Fe/Co/Zn/Cd) transporter